MEPLKLDHVVLVTKDLSAAARQFKQLGFSITPGGKHANGLTQNVLVIFADGTYLEVVSPIRPAQLSLLRTLRRFGLLGLVTYNQSLMDKRFIQDISTGPGIVDFALNAEDLETTMSESMRRGLLLLGPVQGSRQRFDGPEVSYRTAVPPYFDLPFLIADNTPRSLRVPPAEDMVHTNGAQTIVGLSLVVKQMSESLARYRSLLGSDPDTSSHFALAGTQIAEFHLQLMTLSLAAPQQGAKNLRSYPGSRTGRPYCIYLGTDNGRMLTLSYQAASGYTISTETR